MADEFAWTLDEIRSEFRSLTGRSTTGAVSDTVCNQWINDYYTNYFPEDAKVDDLNDFNTFVTSAVDNGEYALAASVLKIDDPITVNGQPIAFYSDNQLFFEHYPENEQYITAPSLDVGSVDSAQVLTAAFSYRIAGFSYSKASAETAFSGLSTVPQNKYGAFSLTVDADGTITINEAADNATGYATPTKAIAGLEPADADEAFLGYVTVISTDAGGFVPGTTALDDAAVTDTYTDGQPSNRNVPLAILRHSDKLYVRPRADDIYQIKYPYRKRPVALEGDTSAPTDTKWGPMIALGAAVLYLLTRGNTERAEKLAGGKVSLADFRMKSISRKGKRQNQRRHVKPSF